MSDDKPPWKKPAPKGAPPTKLTPEMREKAAARARAAGRPYPNLVDNMWAAREQRAAAEPDVDD